MPPGIDGHRLPDVLAHIRAQEFAVRDRFMRDATVTNLKKGYVSVPSVNQLIDTRFQEFAAEMIAYHFNGTRIDKVVGIPYSGIPLATAVAGRLGRPLAPGRKGIVVPGAWKTPILVNEDVPSFTTGETSKFVFNGLVPGDKVLLIDDVIAFGDTTSLIVKELRKQDIEVELAVYFAKLFQPGVTRLKDENIEPFYAIGIREISKSGIKLAPPHY